jgi:asparagine synthase (glutamine-hydrolysing)
LKEDEWVERLDVALCDAVKSHLVSDVPFGAFLSGGVDSSAVVAYMSRILNTPVRTFTIGFNEAENDERNYARHVAKSLGTEHHEEVVLPDALGILPELVEHYGEPFADNSAIPAYYVSRLASQHVKMVLSGDGGDELFAGYGYYANMLRYHPVPKNLLGKSRRFAGNIARLMGLRPPLRTPPETWYGRTPYFSEEQRKNLWRKEFHYLLEATRRWNHEQFEPVKGSDLLTQCQYVDIHNYLTFNNLNKMDIASMCHGLEVRVPLVDHEFLEFAATIPPEMKLRQFSGEMGQEKISNREDPITKYILKKTVSKFFSSEFINRPKMGFSAPVPVWLGGPWQDELQSRLNSLPAALGDLFDLNYINRLTKEHPTIHDHGLRLWSLLFFAEWREQTRHRSLI